MSHLPVPGTGIDRIETPMPLIDEAVVARNIARVQAYMDEHGRRFRPHVKTHKLPDLARAQLMAGAAGINAQKISEAEAFADAGIDDIFISYNILGAEKIAALKALHARATISVSADGEAVVAGLAAAFDESRPLTVLVECDTGGGRCGVQTPAAAVALAQRIADAPGLSFGGLMTYPKPNGEAAADAFLSEALEGLRKAGLDCPVVSYAGSPSLFSTHKVTSATEHRAGTYIFNDRSMVRAGHCEEADCAMTVLTTVVSRPTPDRAVIDAGSKALTSDLLGFADHGLIVGYPEARIVVLNEEHGIVDLSACGGRRPEVGERVRVIPNHTCVVTNMFDHMVFHRDGTVTRVLPVAARGAVW